MIFENLRKCSKVIRPPEIDQSINQGLIDHTLLSRSPSSPETSSRSKTGKVSSPKTSNSIPIRPRSTIEAPDLRYLFDSGAQPEAAAAIMFSSRKKGAGTNLSPKSLLVPDSPDGVGSSSLPNFSRERMGSLPARGAETVHPDTDDPNEAWKQLKHKRPVKLVRPMKLDTPIRKDAVRFVCIACTHGILDPRIIPSGDVLIVAGDFTSCGLPEEVRSFNDFLGVMKHTYKVVIAGNHELSFDPEFLKGTGTLSSKESALRQAMVAALNARGVAHAKELLTNCIYLEDEEIELFGIKIYGTPWQPSFDNWGFNLPRGEPLLEKWCMIPTGVDVLITHTPPLGHGDRTKARSHTGCVELLNSICKRIHPKYHVFGHIHEGYGCTTNGYTKFINACTCNDEMRPENEPIIFDIQLAKHTKSHYVEKQKGLKTKLSVFMR